MSDSPPKADVPVPRRQLPRWRSLGRVWLEGLGGRLPGRLGWAGQWALWLVMGWGMAAVWRVGQGGGSLPGGVVLALVGVVWAVAVASAATLPLAGFACAGLWLAWHGVALMSPWAGTPWLALPVIWLLAVALAVWAWRAPARKAVGLVLWLGISLGAGWLLAEPSGWNHWLSMPPRIAGLGWVVPGSAIAGVGIWLRPVWRGWACTEPSFGRVWVGGLVVMGLGLTASAWRDFPAAEGWAVGVVEASGPWAAMAWFWLAGAFAIGLVKGTIRATRRLGCHGTTAGRSWWLPAAWLGVTGLEWLATHPSARSVAAWLPQRLVPWLQSGPVPLRMAAEAHAWAGVVVMVVGIGFALQGRDTLRLLPQLNALWIAAFGGLLAAGEALAVAAGTGWTMAGTHWGPAVLLGAGGFWLLAGLRKEGRHEPKENLPPRLGAMAVFLGILLAVEFQSAEAWAWRAGPAALLGLVHLALPPVLYHWYSQGRKTGPDLALSTRGWLVLAGLGSVLPLLHLNPHHASQLAFSPVIWLSVLLYLRWRQPWLDPACGAMAGALLGSATVAAWSRPGLLLPEVPLLPWLNPPSVVLVGPSGRGPGSMMEAAHLTLLLIMGAAGALLGALVFRAKEGPAVPLMPLLADPGAPMALRPSAV